jgi:tRNA pseudouridine55 synthase
MSRPGADVGRRRRRADEPDRAAVLLVDKPVGPTSHDVVQAVRRVSGQSRVGHTGTLDPAATGTLVLGLGRATKLVRFLQAGTKTYAARMVLGVETDSQDADGQVVARRAAGHVDERAFCEAMMAFQGDIVQVPPMVSAVKVDGERLHAKARRGEEVERASRAATVQALVLDAYERPVGSDHPEASFLVTCSAGTYVRTLAHDLGAALGVGGSLVALRRVANGPFTVDESHPLERIRAAGDDGSFDALLVDPVAALLRILPAEQVADPTLARRVVHGAALPARGAEGPLALLHAGQLLAIHADRGDRSRAELVWTRPEELLAPSRLADGTTGAPPSASSDPEPRSEA